MFQFNHINIKWPIRPNSIWNLPNVLMSYDTIRWWRNYSGLVLCKSRGNSRVTASTSRHWKPQESSMWRWFHITSQCHTGPRVALPGCGGGSVWGSALLVVGFSVLVSILLRSLSMSGAALMRALRLRGSCSWLGERKGSWMVGYLISCPGCAVTRHLEQ